MADNDIPERTEVLIIGAGPGGYAAAFEAARLGLDTTLINDEAEPGGTCLRRGCIPSKTLLHLAELKHAIEGASGIGMKIEPPRIDLDTVRERKDKVIQQLTGGVAQLCKQRGVRLIQGQAQFEGNDQVKLSGEQSGKITFEHAIIATGSRPTALPGADFGKQIMSSTEALELHDIPESLLVVGGGYIGLEMGMVYQALGSKVTLVEMTDRLMPGADKDLVKPLAEHVDSLFESVYLDTSVDNLETTDNKVKTTLKTGDDESRQAQFDRVLVAVGRQPNTDNLNLDATDATLDDKGFIEVDDSRRTDAGHIFAIGDAAGGMLLAHEAMHEGKVAARAIAGQNAVFDARAIPAVVFTNPQVAWCGLTERQIEDDDHVKILRFPWQAAGRAVSMDATRGMTKLLVESDSGRVLGLGIVGPQAESLIAEGALAMEMGATAEDVAETIHPHPTLTESVSEAAELFAGQATHYG